MTAAASRLPWRRPRPAGKHSTPPGGTARPAGPVPPTMMVPLGTVPAAPGPLQAGPAPRFTPVPAHAPLPSYTPAPAPDPVRDTGVIPALAGAQQALSSRQPADRETLRRVASALRGWQPRGQHPFDATARTEVQRVLEDTPAPRLTPLPRPLPKTRRTPAAVVQRRMARAAYPPVDVTSDKIGDYTAVMHLADLLTGTTGLHPARATGPIALRTVS